MKPKVAAFVAVLAVATVLLFVLDESTVESTHRTRSARDTRPADSLSDHNPLGPLGPTEPPAPDETYVLTVNVGRNVRISVEGLEARVVETGSESQVRLTDLAAGFYRVMATGNFAVGSAEVLLDRNREITIELAEAAIVSGVVRGVGGVSIAGATVEAVAISGATNWQDFSKRLGTPDRIVARFPRSGTDGAYVLLLPGTGQYGLRAHARGYAAAVEPTRPYGASTRGIDFYLAPGRTLAGRIENEAGDPVAGAHVVAATYSGAYGDLADKAQQLSTLDGRFSLTVPPVAWLHLAVSAPGYARRLDPRFHHTGKEITVVLRRGVTVRLRVVDARTRQPLEGAAVRILEEHARTGSDGFVAIENLRPPARRSGYRALVTHADYAPQLETLRSTADGQDGIVVALERGGIVRGTVRDKQTEAPIADAVIMPFGGRSQQLIRMTAPEVRTDARGRYELRGVPLDTGTVLARHPQYVSALDRRELVARLTGAGLFRDGATDAVQDIDLLPARVVRGVVVAPDGSPVAGARVQPRRQPYSPLGVGTLLAITGSDGRFVLGGFREGAHPAVFATHRDFGRSRNVTADTNAAPDLTIRLATALALRGVVVDDANRPVQGVRVEARARVGRSTRSAYSDGAGVFLIRNAPNGKLTLTLDHPGFLVHKHDLTLPDDAREHDVGTVRLERGLRIAGIVEIDSGVAAVGIQIHVSWRGDNTKAGRAWATAVTDEKGRFAFSGLGDGPYSVIVSGNRYLAEQPTVPSGTTDVRIHVRPTLSLRGRVMAGREPVFGAWIRASAVGSRLASTRTDRSGRFILYGLPDGAFVVRIVHTEYRSTEVRGVRAGNDGERIFELMPGAVIAGQVVDAAGKPVNVADLRVFVEGKAKKWLRTGADGSFRCIGLDAGRIEIEMRRSAAGHIPSGRIEVRAGDEAIRIVVVAGESIRGKAVFLNPEAHGARIEAINAAGQPAGSAWVMPSRRTFEIRALRKGTYTLRVTRHADKAEVIAKLPGIESGTDNLRIEVK